MSTLSQSLATAGSLIAAGDSRLVQTVELSLRVSAAACLLGMVMGVALGGALALSRLRWRGLLVALLNTLLALPSVVVGLLVYLLLSRQGPLGEWGILFTPWAMVFAQSVLVVPLIAALAHRLLLDALAEGGEQLRSLGAGPVARALLMLVHARRALLTIAITAFGRAVSEVGAVMIVGGNIEGVTRVMTTSIALETSRGDLPLALGLGMVLLAVVASLHGLAALIGWAGSRVRGAVQHAPALASP
jgi:ABC-type tungstate transport system substrate-binding protein